MDIRSLLEFSNERGRIRQDKIPFGFAGFGDTVNAVLCGKYLELTITPEKQHIGFSNSSACGVRNKDPETPESILSRSATRSRRQVRRLCNCNNFVYMHTLTFAIGHIKYFRGERPFILVPAEDQKDRERVVVLWKEFVRKLRKHELYKGREFRYIAVIEKHTGKRSKDTTIKYGCYHIHFVSDRLFHKRQLQHMWRHGLCNHSDWTHGRKKHDLDDADTLPPPDNPGAYLSKYVGKDAEQAEGGKKRYWASRNLRKPIPIRGSDALRVAGYGVEIYRRDRLIMTHDDGTQIHSYTSTIVLPDDRLYTAEFSGCSDTPEKRRKKRRKMQYENHLYQQHAKEREAYEKLYRKSGEGIIDRFVKGHMRLEAWTRRENKADDMDATRTQAVTRRRIPEFGPGKWTIKTRVLGRKRARIYKKGHLYPTGRVVFRSKGTPKICG